MKNKQLYRNQHLKWFKHLDSNCPNKTNAETDLDKTKETYISIKLNRRHGRVEKKYLCLSVYIYITYRKKVKTKTN